jgi:hypothetical protein
LYALRRVFFDMHANLQPRGVYPRIAVAENAHLNFEISAASVLRETTAQH